jgi:hypothetical protein
MEYMVGLRGFGSRTSALKLTVRLVTKEGSGNFFKGVDVALESPVAEAASVKEVDWRAISKSKEVTGVGPAAGRVDAVVMRPCFKMPRGGDSRLAPRKGSEKVRWGALRVALLGDGSLFGRGLLARAVFFSASPRRRSVAPTFSWSLPLELQVSVKSPSLRTS